MLISRNSYLLLHYFENGCFTISQDIKFIQCEIHRTSLMYGCLLLIIPCAFRTFEPLSLTIAENFSAPTQWSHHINVYLICRFIASKHILLWVGSEERKITGVVNEKIIILHEHQDKYEQQHPIVWKLFYFNHVFAPKPI